MDTDLDFGVNMWEPPVFQQPFELWRDTGVLHLVLADHAYLRRQEMKEMIRLIGALDGTGRVPVMIDHAPDVAIEDDARALLVRICRAQGHPVVVYTTSTVCQRQLELFRQVHRPRFPFHVAASREEAWSWSRMRIQEAAAVWTPERP
ncbi:MAG: hypothetical protein H6591_12495 [Flavobacteriales bacterium]|nr:hypothetical protein [Flavobacteriales bacterium]